MISAEQEADDARRHMAGIPEKCSQCSSTKSELMTAAAKPAPVLPETAEDVYIRQHATIADAIERLQGILDNMLAPDDNEITWADVAHHAQIVDALATFNESVGS